MMLNRSAGLQESFSNPKGGIKLVQPKNTDHKLKTEETKAALLQQQYIELRDINAKMTIDQGLLTANAKIH
jgi:hypothetical protein